MKSAEYSVVKSYNYSISENLRFEDEDQKTKLEDDDFFYEDYQPMNFDNAYFDVPGEFESQDQEHQINKEPKAILF